MTAASELRPYQRDAIEAIRQRYREGARAVLLQAPTGAGKTVIFSATSSGASARGNRTLILVHRRELIRQASEKLTAAGVDHGVVAAGYDMPGPDAMVIVASIQTIIRRLDRLPPDVALIIADEAHHACGPSWMTVIAHWPKARLLGVTATPQRLDGKGLGRNCGGPFDALVVGPSVAELIAGGYLCRFRIFAPGGGGPDLTGVRTVGGDYDAGQLADAMGKPTITGSAVDHYARLCPGAAAVVFCASIRHATETAEAFRAAGWRAQPISGKTPKPERDDLIAGLGDGRVQVLCNCDLIGEGLDVPNIGAVILLRPTQSLCLFLQHIGRGLRPSPGKDALIVLDHAGNTMRHGMPDAPRDWTLDGRAKKQRDAIPPVKQCRSCYAIVPQGATACPECGAELEVKARQVKHVAGQLAELDQAELDRLRRGPLGPHVERATTRAELELIRLARGFKRGWTFHVLREREDREAMRGEGEHA